MISFTPQNLVLYLVENGILTNTALFRFADTQSDISDPTQMFNECGLQRFICPRVVEQQKYDALRSFSEACKNASETQILAHLTRFYKELARLRNGSANPSIRTRNGSPTLALAGTTSGTSIPLSTFPKPDVHDSIPDNDDVNSNKNRSSVKAIDIQVDKEHESWMSRPWTSSHTAQRSRRSRHSSSSKTTSFLQSARSSTSLGAYSSAASSIFNSAASSVSSVGTSTSSRKAKEHSAAEWRRRQDDITKLYIEQDMALKQVQTIMKLKGFDATQRQYKRKFEEWQLRKNLTREDKLIIIAKQHQRRVLGKRTVFAINGKPMGDLMLSKLLKGVQSSSADLLGGRRTPPQITYFTPPENDTIDVMPRLYPAIGLDKEIIPGHSPQGSQSNKGEGIEPNRHSTNILHRMDELDLAPNTSSNTGTYPVEMMNPLLTDFTLPQGTWSAQMSTSGGTENPMPVHEGINDPAYLDFGFEELFTPDEAYWNGPWDNRFGNAGDESLNWLDDLVDDA